jgi:hypothetical protein
MRRTRGWTGLRHTVLGLGFVAATAGAVQAAAMPAAPVMTFSTVGSTITNGATVSGTPAVSFTPLMGSQFLAPSALSFGKFTVAALPDGQSVTYNNTPFDIKFAAPGSTPSAIDITGKLNGTIVGSSQSSVMATFDPLKTSTFQSGSYTNTLQLPTSPVWVVPSSSNHGETTIQAFLSSVKVTTPSSQDLGSPAPVPEPSTVLLFAATMGGLFLRRRLLLRRDG